MIGSCESCGVDLSVSDIGYDVRYDQRREFAMGAPHKLLRIVPTGTHVYCTACAVNAPEPQTTSIIVATKEQAEFLTPIYESHGWPAVREFDEIPPKIC